MKTKMIHSACYLPLICRESQIVKQCLLNTRKGYDVNLLKILWILTFQILA